MKTKMMSLMLAASALLAAQAEALEIQVAPLKLEASVEVLGLDLGVDGGKVVVLAGESAAFVAATAGVALDTTKEVIILSGNEVEALLKNPIGRVAHYGHTTIVATGELSVAALDLAEAGIQAGVKVVRAIPGTLNTVAQKTVATLAYAATHPVTFVSDTGVKVLRTGSVILGHALNFTCGVLGFIGINIGSCGQ